MLKFFRERVLGVFKSRKGANEIIAFVMILIFVILAVAPKVKSIGKTTGQGVDKLDSDLKIELGI